ncbi:aminodeoxychorismate lyase [Diplodia corticola]|uniref:Aminodeoxychorismate lyase n=1 Tax=Diplodia corticola TaxID=236234 RepID=A0A1J9R2F1_9PEZI|nr:aminodeoxychorismate lyase [Diplodia corticola]OJD34808.1 aminodeoxychorismate lyase [Diplodia corticola]
MPAQPASFSLFTSLRHDPALRSSPENSSDIVSFSPSSPFYMLRYHRDRMLEAAQHFEWTEVAKKLADGKNLESLLNQEVESWRSQNGDAESPLKVRVLFNRPGDMQTDIATTPAIPLSSLYPATFTTPPPPASSSSSKPFTPSPRTGGALLDPTLPPSSPKPPPPPSPPAWTLTIDTSPTPTSPHTLLKTTHRAHYDAARARSAPAVPGGGGTLHEVLLWNTVGEMTEGSFTSAYFYRGGRWVTPPVGVPDNVSFSSSPSSSSPPPPSDSLPPPPLGDEGELRSPFPGRWGHSIRSPKAVPVGGAGGGQRGTTRRWALKRGLCMEEPVARETVAVGEWVWVSNGVRGFGMGRVVETAAETARKEG